MVFVTGKEPPSCLDCFTIIVSKVAIKALCGWQSGSGLSVCQLLVLKGKEEVYCTVCHAVVNNLRTVLDPLFFIHWTWFPYIIWAEPVGVSLSGDNGFSWTQRISKIIYIQMSICRLYYHFQWRIQDFPRGGANSQKCYYFSIFCRKLHENERIWTPRGGACVPGAPPWIRQWFWYCMCCLH